MPTFTRVEGATCILKSAGIYTQADIYTYNGHLFAKRGSGFVMLHKSSFGEQGTSSTKISWEGLEGVKFTTEVGKTALKWSQQ